MGLQTKSLIVLLQVEQGWDWFAKYILKIKPEEKSR